MIRRLARALACTRAPERFTQGFVRIPSPIEAALRNERSARVASDHWFSFDGGRLVPLRSGRAKGVAEPSGPGLRRVESRLRVTDPTCTLVQRMADIRARLVEATEVNLYLHSTGLHIGSVIVLLV